MTPSDRARWALRRATAPARSLPDFIVIGAPRSGTTTLYRALARHSRVVAASNQEIHFFNRSATYDRGLTYYRSFFPLEASLRRHDAITGEGTSVYMFRPNTAERIAADLPAVRLVAVLRDPVERAIESWLAFSKRGEDDRPLVAAIESELVDLDSHHGTPPPPDEVTEGRHDPAHVQKGRYADQLRRWMRLFDDTRLLTVFSEDLFSAPDETLGSVLSFLGLPPEQLEIGQPPSREEPSGVESVRERLGAYFLEPDRDLAELLQRDLPWR